MTGSPSRYRQLIRRAMAFALPRSLYITHGPRSDSRICLTFDDGPHPEYTPRLLTTLEELNIRATFFVQGQAAAAHPEIVKRMADDGHDVGHHSYSHREPAATDAASLGREIDRTLALLASLGLSSTLFRPPNGKITAAKTFRIWARGQAIVLWNRDPKDFTRATAAQVAEWLRGHPVGSGDIVLMHDTHPHAADVLPAFAADVRARGLSFARVSDWCRRSGRPARRGASEKPLGRRA